MLAPSPLISNDLILFTCLFQWYMVRSRFHELKFHWYMFLISGGEIWTIELPE